MRRAPATFLARFFILSPLVTSCLSSTDYSNGVAIFRMGDDKQTANLGLTDKNIPMIIDAGMIRIRYRERQGVSECGRSFGETDPVFSTILRCFANVPGNGRGHDLRCCA